MIISRITYAAAGSGFATVAECNALQAFLNKVRDGVLFLMTEVLMTI